MKEKGFTLIELLVVIAILGVIAAVIALNVGNFFGRSTLQAANTELHQVQTAVTACMSECETRSLKSYGWWNGTNETVYAGCNRTNGENDAAFYVYGMFRARYYVAQNGEITDASCNGTNEWGNLLFCDGRWQEEPC